MVVNMSTIVSKQEPKTTPLDENLWVVWKYPLIAFLLGFTILIPLVFLSLDMHDPGFLLSNQLIANKIGVNYYRLHGTVFLSDLIGGRWLLLTSSLGLVGAKLGGVIIYATCASLKMKIFQSYVQNRIFLLKAVVCALLIATFSLHRMSLTLHPNYYTIPMLFALVYISILMHFIKSPKISTCVFLGSLLTVLYFCRFTMIVLWVTPLISIWVIEKDKRKLVLIIYGVAILSLVLSLAILNSGFQELLYGVNDVVAQGTVGHQGSWIVFHTYLAQVVKALSIVGYVCLVVSPFFLLKSKVLRNRIIGWIGFFSFAFIGLAPFFPSKISVLPWFTVKPLQSFFYDDVRMPWFQETIMKLQDRNTIGLTMTLILILATSYIVFNLFKLHQRKNFSIKIQKELLFLTLVAILLILSFLGSTSGLDRACFGTWLLIGLCAVVSCEKWQMTYLSKWFMLTNTICLLFLYSCFHMDYLYSFSKLSIGKEGVLKGTITRKEKHKALAELLPVIGERVEKGDYIFGYHSMPMIYYLTDTVPITLTDYCFVTMKSKDQLEERLNENFSKRAPKIIVKSKFNPFRPKWDYMSGNYKKDPIYADFVSEKVDLIERKLEEFYKPTKIWSNAAFEVYVPDGSSFEDTALD